MQAGFLQVLLLRSYLHNTVFRLLSALSLSPREIVHPAVKEEVNKKIKKEERKNTNLLIVESAVLVEDHYNEICDELWYIYVEDAVRRNRLYYSRGYDNKKIDEIIAAQLPKEMFLKACDRVIDNSGIFAETMIQIDQIVKEL